MNEEFKLHAGWTSDCNGKQDYDGSIVSISTRYWPDFTARCSLGIDFDNRPDDFPDHYSLIEREFAGTSEADVKIQVERWAQVQMDKAVKAVRDAFYIDPNGSPR